MSKSDSEWVCKSERKRKNDKKITDYFNQNCRLLGSNSQGVPMKNDEERAEGTSL